MKEKIIADYQSGMTYRALSDKYNCSIPSIYYHIKTANLIGTRDGNPKKKISDTVRQEICKRYSNGATHDEIINEFGIGSTSLYRILHQNGITTHRVW